MIKECPVCKHLYNGEGFQDFMIDVLYYCKCGTVIKEDGSLVDSSSVDFSGLQINGIFIRADRQISSIQADIS